MKASETKVLDFLHKPAQFIIPIYQRNYSWTPKQCEQLWRDILRAGGDDSVSGHFIGSVVYVERGLYSHSSIPQLLVIDGQQRLTTISLLIAALGHVIAQRGRPDGIGVNRKKLVNYYLLNPEEDDDLHYKLLLNRTDKETLKRIVEDKQPPDPLSKRLMENFNYFVTQLTSGKSLLATVYQGLAKLIIVDIALNREHDNPQLIFESLNSTGLELTQADLIRNYVLMGLGHKAQTQLYNEHWYPMECLFGQTHYANLFDRFMRDYLTLKTGAIPNIRAVYDAFKSYAWRHDSATPDAIVANIHRYARHFATIALGLEKDPDLRRCFDDINTLKVDVAYPFLLELYDDYTRKVLDKQNMIGILQLLESFVFRRAICGIPTNSLNKTFATLAKEVDKSRYLDSTRAVLQTATTYRRFPDDSEFQRELKAKDLYKFRNRNYALSKLENHGRKEPLNVEDYTIEHVMPQNPNLSAAWRTELGSDWRDIHERYLHTLGNLTLTGYNPELSDRPFQEKRDMEGGFGDSPIRLNKSLAKQEHWNEDAIQQRADKLSALATQVWPYTGLSADQLAQFPNLGPKRGKTYTLDDHAFLKGPMLELFQQFRKHVLNLDASVTEEILKLYIAYKFTTNFVDVVPQASRLRLSLNLPFNEIHDPKGLCKDVSNVGRWGNGDVEVGLSSLEQIPDVLYLVRQAFEKQRDTETA